MILLNNLDELTENILQNSTSNTKIIITYIKKSQIERKTTENMNSCETPRTINY